MTRQTVSVTLDFAQGAEQLFACFAKHENQADIFGVKVARLSDGAPHPDGVGSRRRIHAPPLPSFEETITAFEPPRRIEYRMRNSWKNAIRDHLGVLVFTPLGPARTRLEYTITFVPKVPFTARVIRSMTERNLRRGLEALAAAPGAIGSR